MTKNVMLIPGTPTWQHIDATRPPGVPFVGNEMYYPTHVPVDPAQDQVLFTPGVPVQYIRLATPGIQQPSIFYPTDIGAPSADVGCDD